MDQIALVKMSHQSLSGFVPVQISAEPESDQISGGIKIRNQYLLKMVKRLTVSVQSVALGARSCKVNEQH